MSDSSKSQNSAKLSSSRGSLCPPTARSPSLTTASALTDPHQIPTALSNSVTTARGATQSDLEPLTGLSDTSAGSGRANSTNPSETNTAKSPTSPEILMNDLRRGSLFGRQTKSQVSEGPHSVTNITFSNNNSTSLSTASKISSTKTALSAGKHSVETPRSRPGSASRKSDLTSTSQLGSINPSEETSVKSTRTAKSRFNKSAISTGASKSRKRKSVGRKMKELKNQEASGKVQKPIGGHDASGKSAKSQTRNQETSGKSAKSKQIPNISRAQDASGKSLKTSKSMKIQKPLDDKSAKSGKGFAQNDFSAKSQKTKSHAANKPEFGKSGVVKKGDKQKDQSVYFPGVMNPPTAPLSKNGKSAGRQAPTYNWPGNGKCTRNMDALAPPSSTAPIDSSVYNVSNLSASQRGLPPSGPPKSLFGTRKMATAPGLSSVTSVKEQPLGNKILIIGQTPDGKTTVQMTIDMQIVAGVGMGASNEPVDLKPKKVVVAGNEYSLDTKKTG